MIFDKGRELNPARSSLVRKKIKLVKANLDIPYIVMGRKANMSASLISQFITGNRDFSDLSLDRLEPTVNDYLKLLGFMDEITKGKE